MNISEKQMANLEKSFGLLLGLVIVLLILFDVYHITFIGYTAVGLYIVASMLVFAYFMLDDIIELRNAIQNNDLEKLVDMRGKAIVVLKIYVSVSPWIIMFALYVINVAFGFRSHIAAFLVSYMFILMAMPLAHEVYIIKKASPGADRWWEGTSKACALEQSNRNRPQKEEDYRHNLMR